MGRRDERGGQEEDPEPFDAEDLDAKVCPTCWRELAPRQMDCPACREPAVLRFGYVGGPVLPTVPEHLRDAVEQRADDPDVTAAATAEAGHTATAEVGAHKPVDDPLVDPAPAEAPVTPLGPLPWPWPGTVGGGGDVGGIDGGGGC